MRRGDVLLGSFVTLDLSTADRGYTHAPAYDQVSRMAVCIVNAAHLVVLYPADSRNIDPARYTQAARTQEYLEAGGPGRGRGLFAEG
jgi:hypothetical protein